MGSQPMLRALALASLVLLAPAPVSTANDEAALARLVRHSDRILVVSVLNVKTLEQRDEPVNRGLWSADELPIAELMVERTLVGPRGEERVYALAARPVAGKLKSVLKRGERALVFLERDELFERHASERTRAEIAAHCGGARLKSIAPVGLWKLDEDGACALPSEIGALPQELAKYAKAGVVPSLPLLHWTAKRVAAELPWAQISYGVMAVTPPVRVEANREVYSSSRTEPSSSLSPAEWHALWKVIAEADVFDLPWRMGTSRGPCLDYLEIAIHTREGSWSGLVNFEKASTPLEELQLAQVKPVYDAIAKLRRTP